MKLLIYTPAEAAAKDYDVFAGPYYANCETSSMQAARLMADLNRPDSSGNRIRWCAVHAKGPLFEIARQDLKKTPKTAKAQDRELRRQDGNVRPYAVPHLVWDGNKLVEKGGPEDHA